jgi:predicted enzyme related to lactoylglutathione lyase
MAFGPYGVFSLGGTDVAGMAAMAPGMPAEPAAFWTPYFEVTDPDETAGRCADLGGRVLQDAVDIEPGRFALLADQVGATFGIIRGR